MPGFFITNYAQATDLENVFEKGCVQSDMFIDGVRFQRNTLNKFIRDKVFLKNEQWAVVTACK